MNENSKNNYKYDISSIQLEKEIKIHQSSVNSFCIAKEDKIISCSSDGTIKILNLLTYQCELTIKCHKVDVLYVSILDNGDLASSSLDETIKIWKSHTFELIYTLTGHTGYIIKIIQLSGHRLASCSYDLKIKIWKDKPPYHCIFTLTGHRRLISSLIELKNKSCFVSGSVDGTIRFWNNSTYECERIIENVECWSNNSLVEIDNKLIVGEDNGVSIISCFELCLQCKIKFSNNIGDIFSIIDLNDGTFLCGSEEGCFVQIDIKECKLLSVKFKAHSDIVRCLGLYNENKIISCSREKVISVWKK